MELSQAELITARKRSLGQGNVFTPVCDSVHGEVSTPLHAAPPPPGQTPLGRHPPWADTPSPSDTTGYGQHTHSNEMYTCLTSFCRSRRIRY